MKIAIILLTLICASMGCFAQTGDADSSPAVLPVVNEDAGRACMVVKNALSLIKSRPSAEIVEPKQYSIFLGSAWASAQTRIQKSELLNVLADPGLIDTAVLADMGWKDAYNDKGYRDQPLREAGPLFDLRIQSILTSIVKNEMAGRAAGDNVYVIYLSPDLDPHLGQMLGGKHYLSYYNAVNIAGSRIRYIVVPFDQDIKTLKTNALSGLLASAVLPTCSEL